MQNPSTIPLRVLIIEDSNDDALLMVNELHQHKYDVTFTRVESAHQLSAALDDGEWDIILSDHSLPGFSGPAALKKVKERGFEIPFIVVSGTIGEDEAVEAMKAGAADFFTKKKLSRLGPAVKRELTFAQERKQRKQAEIELRALKDRFEKVFHASPIVITITNSQARYVDVNDRFVQFLGYSREEVIGRTSAELDIWVHANDRDLCRNLLIEHGHVRDYETQFRAKAGTIHDGLISMEVIDLNGDPSVVSMVHDITERKRAEEALQTNQRFVEQVQEVAHIGSWSSGLEPNDELVWSKEVFRIFGVSEAKFDGKVDTFFKSIHPDDLDAVVAASEAALHNNVPFSLDHRIIRPDGVILWIHEQAQIIRDANGQPLRMIGVAQDITERKHAEQELKLNQTFIEQAQEVAHIGSWSSGLNLDNKLIWSKEVYRIFGISEAEFDGKINSFYSFVHPDDIEMVKSANEVALTGKASYSIDHRIIRPTGEIRWIREQAEIIREENGQPLRLIGVAQDITERKQADEALRQNEELLRTILETLPVGVWLTDKEGNSTYGNPASHQIWAASKYGLSNDFSEYRGWWADSGELIKLDEWAVRRAVTYGEKSLNQKIEIECHDGSHKHILNSALPLRNGNQEIVGALIVNQDISELKAMENELRALYNAVSFLYKADSLHNLGHQIVQAVVTEFGKIDCGLMIIDKTQGKLIRLARAGEYHVDTEAPLYLNGPGLVPEAVRTGTVTYSPDVIADTRYVSNHPETRSELVVPLKTAKGVIAVLDLQSTQTDAFSDTDQRILIAFAERAAAAIENMQLYDEINRYAAELEWRVAVRTDQLRRVKERVEAILDNNGDAIILVRADGLIAQTNPAFNELFGYTQDEAIGQSLMNLIEADKIELLRQTLAQVVQINKTMRIEITAVRPNGMMFAAEMALSSIAKDQTLGIVCSIRDISERKRAEERQLALTTGLRAVVTSASELIACEDTDTFFRRAVEIAREQLKLERCAIFVKRDNFLCGTYGTDIQGNTVNEQDNCFSMDSSGWPKRLLLLDQQDERWVQAHEMRFTWDGEKACPLGHGWTVSTPIPSSKGLVGMMFNDSAISETPLDSVQQDVVAVFCSLLGNIMDRKGAEEELLAERNLLRTMIDNLPDQIYVKDTASRLIITNLSNAAARGLKQTSEGIGETDFDVFESEHAAEYYSDEQAVMQTGQPLVNKEEIMLTAAGERRIILSTKVPLHDTQGKIIGLVGLGRDITERKKMEDDLRAALKKERELGELKSRFSSMVSHEFRTPLATIQSSNDLLKRYGDRMSEERKIEHIEEVEAQIRHLTGLLDDIMTISKAETVGLDFNPAPLDLEHYCDEMVEQFRLIAGKQRIHYTCANPCSQAVMDGRLLHRVLNNLLSNAIKYSAPESTVYFNLSCEAEYATIEVRDEGIGIPEDDLDSLFEIFHRAKNVGDINGTGLGLAIVKRAIEVHGGSISVKSELGVGTTFSVFLPLVAQLPKEIDSANEMVKASRGE